MRGIAVLLFLALGSTRSASDPVPSQSASPAPAQTGFEESTPAQVEILHQAWLQEHDPVKRAGAADRLCEAIIHQYGNPDLPIFDEVVRNGAPLNELAPPLASRSVPLEAVTTLAGAHVAGRYNVSPLVFRRLAKNRFEIWTYQEGWLFDRAGRKIAHVHVPRRDGLGRDWFGAFLPDGTWITTDLWGNDQQLNCFTPKGKWKWELSGTALLARRKDTSQQKNSEIAPSIGWARSDKTGSQWLVSLGTDFWRAFFTVTPTAGFRSLSDTPDLWKLVYPRSLGVRGFYIELFINSDDGLETLHRSSAGHGVYVGWPTFQLSQDWKNIIPEGDDQFGFWPRSHDVYIEAEEPTPELHKVWFFAADGRYQGEVSAAHLGDASNGRDLLLQDNQDRVLTVATAGAGLKIILARNFTWPDGSRAIPVALYDDLRQGFFLRGPNMNGTSDDAWRARQAAEIVLAKWQD
jgi:hypothetical protein